MRGISVTSTDPDSNVSTMTRERGGFSLLAELGYAPVNQYLPPRAVPTVAVASRARVESRGGESGDGAGALARLIARARAVLEG